MNCNHCNVAGQVAGQACAQCGNVVGQPGMGQAAVAFGPQMIQMPAFALGVAQPQNQQPQNQQPQNRGWLWGLVAALIGLVGLVVIGILLWGALKSDPEQKDYSADFAELKATTAKIDATTTATATDATATRTAAENAAALGQANHNIVTATHARVLQTGVGVDRALGVVYDSQGNVAGTQTLADAVAAARAAETAANGAKDAASRRPRVIVRRTTVDLSDTNARLSRIERAISAPPVLERVE